MTDIETRTWHSISEGPDAELAEARRLLAAAELRAVEAETRAINAVAAEDVAQFAFETAKLRADRLEPALQRALIDLITPRLPEALENSAEAIADDMVDDITTGTLYDDLDLNGHIETRMEQRR
jgi:hypothetical protein